MPKTACDLRPPTGRLPADLLAPDPVPFALFLILYSQPRLSLNIKQPGQDLTSYLLATRDYP